MTQPNDQSCGTCRFYQTDARLAEFYKDVAPEQFFMPERTGWCMRFPPHLTFVDQATNRMLSRFAAVPDMWWCGEYKSDSSQPPTKGD